MALASEGAKPSMCSRRITADRVTAASSFVFLIAIAITE
jgi:hypothetical protein